MWKSKWYISHNYHTATNKKSFSSKELFVLINHNRLLHINLSCSWFFNTIFFQLPKVITSNKINRMKKIFRLWSFVLLMEFLFFSNFIERYYNTFVSHCLEIWCSHCNVYCTISFSIFLFFIISFFLFLFPDRHNDISTSPEI